MEKHVSVLGILHILFALLGIFAGVVLFVVMVGSGFISGDREAMTILTLVGSLVGGFLLLISIPGLIGGIGLLRWQPWARMLVLILGFINLINIPLGTALGIYTIWVLLNDEAIELFQNRRNQ